MSGIVYCLTNEATPEYIKTGLTSDLEQRLRLDNTSVPLPFECVFAVEIDNPEKVERLLHQAFANRHVRSEREFFDVGAEHVMAAMKLAGGKDVTPDSVLVEDEESERAFRETKQSGSASTSRWSALAPGTELYFKTTRLRS